MTMTSEVENNCSRWPWSMNDKNNGSRWPWPVNYKQKIVEDDQDFVNYLRISGAIYKGEPQRVSAICSFPRRRAKPKSASFNNGTGDYH